MSNLASVIMEGVQATHSNDDLYGNYDFSGSVVAESSYMTSACATLFSEILEADQSYMVADIVGAATAIHEAKLGHEVDVKAITEGVIKDGIAKIVAAFQKFIAKVREFYKKVIDWFKAMFSNSENFAKNYGEAIKKKAKTVKGFQYKGYKYDVKGGDDKVGSFNNEVKKEMNKLIADGYDIATSAKNSQEFHEMLRGTLKSDFDSTDKLSATEVVEKFIKANYSGVDNVSELNTALVKLYRGGSDTESELKDFEGNSADSMVDFLKESNSKISDFKNQLKTFEDATGNAIKKLKSFDAKGDENASNLVSHASYISQQVTAFLNLYKDVCNVKISMYKQISQKYLGTLKKFYNYKSSVKESAEVYDADAFAALESSLVLFEGSDSEPAGTDPKEPEGDGDGTGKEEGATESTLNSILEAAAQYMF